MSHPHRVHRQPIAVRQAVAILLILGLGAVDLAANDLPELPDFLAGLPGVNEPYEPQQETTRELQRLIEEHDGYREAFQEAIDAVYVDAIPELSRIQSLDQYYFFLDAMVTWIPGIRVWDTSGTVMHERTPYLRITQFYYYFNKPSLKALQSPVQPVEGEKLTPLTRWMREFARNWGVFLDTPESTEFLETFRYAPEYTVWEYQKRPEEYATFNEFFARQFSDLSVQRPVASPHDDRVIVSPADATYIGQWTVSTAQDPGPSIVVKHIEWPIPELLADSEHAADFAGGILTHSFLNTYNYHRQHAPVSGCVLEAKVIPAQVYLEVTLDDDGLDASSDVARAVIPRRYLDAQDRTGYQFVQSRGLIVIQSPIGKVAVLPMGMAQVSSIVFVDPDDPQKKGLYRQMPNEQDLSAINKMIADKWVGRWVEKGEMFSYFQFGGSDIVTVFERQANVHLTTTAGVFYPVRSQTGNAAIPREELVSREALKCRRKP